MAGDFDNWLVIFPFVSVRSVTVLSGIIFSEHHVFARCIFQKWGKVCSAQFKSVQATSRKKETFWNFTLEWQKSSGGSSKETKSKEDTESGKIQKKLWQKKMMRFVFTTTRLGPLGLHWLFLLALTGREQKRRRQSQKNGFDFKQWAWNGTSSGLTWHATGTTWSERCWPCRDSSGENLLGPHR